MTLSKKSIDTLIDLVEIKLSTMEIWDREDKRAVRDLQTCLRELSRNRKISPKNGDLPRLTH